MALRIAITAEVDLHVHNPCKYEKAEVGGGDAKQLRLCLVHILLGPYRALLKALTDHLGGGSRVGSFDPY